MKKALMILGIVIAVIAVLIILIFLYLLSRPAVPKDYKSRVKTGGGVEERYLQSGEYEVAYLECPVMQNFKKYEFYYPAEPAKTDKKYPVVIFCNGTGVPASKYSELLRHLASWEFVVAATEEEYSWNGFSAEMCIRRLITLNENETVEGIEQNPFYQRIDFDNVGISGHSQGGVGAINTAAQSEYAAMIKAIYIASPTNKELAKALEWEYNPSNTAAPIFITSSTGKSDESLVVSLEGLNAIYDDIPDTVQKVMARRNDTDHGCMLYYGDGYMTAWFMRWLQGDTQAEKAFVGDDAEILNNPYWQDVRKNG